MPGRLLQAMPLGSKVVVYGVLSEQGVVASPERLIFRKQRVEGFWLSDYLDSLSIPGLLDRAVRVQRALETDLQVKVRAHVALEHAVAGIQSRQEQITGGKVLLIP